MKQDLVPSGGEITPEDYGPTGRVSGHTAFFRYPRFQRSFIRMLARQPRQDEMRILVAPGSVGCEALTLGILAAQEGLARCHGKVSIHSLDVSARFTEIARAGVYHKDMIAHLRAPLRRYFQAAAQDVVGAVPEASALVTILPPSPLLNFETDQPYDAVIAANFLQWVRPEQRAHMDKLGSLSRRFLCMTLPPWDKEVRPVSPDHPLNVQGFHLLNTRWAPVKKTRFDRHDFISGDPHKIYVFAR